MVGHLDTDGLDPTTARAVELLAAADLVAAEEYESGRRMMANARLWRDPLMVVAVAILIVLFVLSFAFVQLSRNQNTLVNNSAAGKQQRETLQKLIEEDTVLSQQIVSCVDPKGDCAKKGEQAQAAAIAVIVSKLTQNACLIAHPNDIGAASMCISQVTRDQAVLPGAR